MKQSQRIVKNAVFGIGASVVGGLVYLATILTIAHSVSVTNFGKYSFVLAFAMFVSNIADSGLPRMIIRELAKDRDLLQESHCRPIQALQVPIYVVRQVLRQPF